jgi:hypothetical protein
MIAASLGMHRHHMCECLMDYKLYIAIFHCRKALRDRLRLIILVI